MISRSLWRTEAAALLGAAVVLAGGCQSAPQGGVSSVPVKPSVVMVDNPPDAGGPQFDGPDQPVKPLATRHDQPPEDVAAQIKKFTRNLPNPPPAGTSLDPTNPENGWANSAAGRSDPTARQSRHAYGQTQTPAVADGSDTESSSGAGSGALTGSRSVGGTAARPGKVVIHPDPTGPANTVDPSALPRVTTLRVAAGSQPMITQPEILPEDADMKTAQTAGAPIAPGTDTGPVDPNASLEDRLRRRAHEFPHDTLAQLDWELYCTLKEDSVGGLSSVALLPDKDRELVSSLVDGIRNFRSTLAAERDPMLEKEIGPLLAMADRLRSQAELQIPVVAICRRVQAWGNYEPMEVDRLPFGKETQVIVYCEVENCVPQVDSRGMWQTRLIQHTALLSDTGTEMWADSAKEIDDTCRNRRRDFFLTNKVTLPASLPAGRYTLKVVVEDVNANKFNEGLAQLTIAPPPTPVKPPAPARTAGPPLWPYQQETTAGSQFELTPATPK